MSRYPSDCKVYVGDLGNNATKQELEDAFGHYGPLKNVWVARNPPGFAFVEFEDARDAEDAVKGLDGRTVCGRRARVEISNGKRSRGPPRRGGGGPAGGGGRGGDGAAARYHPDDKCYDCGERGHYARDCSRQRGSRGSRRRSRSRSRSRSRQRTKRSYSRSGSRSRSRSRNGRPRSLSKSRSTSKSRTPRRSRSATPR